VPPPARDGVRAVAATCAVALSIAVAAACAGGAELGSARTPLPAPTGTTTSAPPSTPAPTSATPTPPPEPPGPVVPTGFADVATGLQAPWGLTFLPDGSALVSERNTARIVRVLPTGQVSEVRTVPGVVPAGEGGLLGIAFGPDPQAGPFVYAYFTAAEDNRVVRMRWDGATLAEPEVILSGIPKATNHDGGRLRFGPDGRLFVATGDANVGDRAQDLSSLGGKVLRLEPDGSVPADNPFPGSLVWTYGHRNVQGLAFDAQGRLWAGEFGQRNYDELNLLQPGGNYGWPVVEGPGGGPEFVGPVAWWTPTGDASPSGIAAIRDTVFLAALAGERLLRVPVPGGTPGAPDAFAVEEFGRLRTVEVAPDGSLWLTTSNRDGRGDPRDGDDRIIRVTLG
jgi:glucose/arabinose dehydrogenase